MSARMKRNAVVAVMAVLVCGAAALNWQFTAKQGQAEVEPQAEETGTKILGEATLVSGQEGETLEETAVYTGSDYFASARLTRQQARDNALELLERAAEEENADTSVLNQASESIQVMAAQTLTESQIENLVTAKGYRDCAPPPHGRGCPG